MKIINNDVLFVNTEKVECHASYSKKFDSYGYYHFGKVVEEEKKLTK